jgi:hypothetical protein
MLATFCLIAVAIGIIFFRKSSAKSEPQAEPSTEQASAASESTTPATRQAQQTARPVEAPQRPNQTAPSKPPGAASTPAPASVVQQPQPAHPVTAPVPPAQRVAASGPWADAFRSATNPTQFAAIAQQFAALLPGQISQPEINAARETLDRAAQGELQGVDVGPIFRALEGSSDPGVVQDLVSRLPEWQYYSTIALAELPNGQGIPALVQQLQTLDPSAAEARTFIFQMLAQVAARYPDAANAILDQARSNQLSERMWHRVANGLAGDQYQLTPDTPQGTANPTDLKSYHMEKGNQNFYSLPLAPGPDVPQRISILDQLMNVTSDPTALGFLQSARANANTTLSK